MQEIGKIREELNELQKMCINEKAMSGYVNGMQHLLSGLVQMRSSALHYYEQKILENPMILFMQYFCEQVRLALEEKDPDEKKELILDIENAVIHILDVCQNIIESTQNKDRHSWASISVDMGMYELSPKICALYADMLKELVDLCDGTDKYAFIIHPTLETATRTEILLEKREKPGKVVIIYISEKDMEAIDITPIYLIHEAFHVLTSEQRKRKSRAHYFFKVLIKSIEEKLFCNLNLEMNEEQIKKFRNELTEIWFQETFYKMSKFMNEADKKEFYSYRLQKRIKKWLYQALKEIDQQIINNIEYVAEKVGYLEDDWDKYLIQKEQLAENTQRIRENLYDIILNREIEKIERLSMFIFREAYSDISCVLILGLKSEQYRDAFIKALPFAMREGVRDDNALFRQYLVARAIQDTNIKSREGWSEFYAKNIELLEEKDYLDEDINETLRSTEVRNENNIQIGLSAQNREYFESYVDSVAKGFQRWISVKPRFLGFQEGVSKLLEGRYQDNMRKILLGFSVLKESEIGEGENR